MFLIKIIWRNFFLYNKILLFFIYSYNKLTKKNYKISFILWPPANKLFEIITNDLSQNYNIDLVKDFHVKAEYFEKFVYDIYRIENASLKKIEFKMSRLMSDQLNMRLIIIKLYKPNLIVQDLLNNLRCVDAHKIKDYLRKKYKSLIDDYMFDIIIHSSESEKQSIQINNIINFYSKNPND